MWSTHLPNQFPVSPSPLCSPLSYFKIPFLALIFFLLSLLHGFSLFLARVYFVQQLPHRAVLQFEPSLWGNALSDREKGGGGGITARLLIRSSAFPPLISPGFKSMVGLISPYLGMKCLLHSCIFFSQGASFRLETCCSLGHVILSQTGKENRNATVCSLSSGDTTCLHSSFISSAFKRL